MAVRTAGTWAFLRLDPYYREIAALPWSADAVADRHPDDALRSRVHRRVAGARALMKCG